MSEARRRPGFGSRESGFENAASNRPTPLDLDAAIDAVAREMTDAEPTGALRARVLDEIAREPRRPGFALPRWAWACAAPAIVAAVAMSVWLVRPAPHAGVSPATTVAQRPAAEPPPATPDAGQASPSAAASSPVPSVPRAAVRLAAQNAEGASPDVRHVPALAEIEPLRFASVEPEALQMPSLDVVPLTAVPSIEVPSLESGSTDVQNADPKKEKRP